MAVDINITKSKEENVKEALKQKFETSIDSNAGLSSYLIFPDGTLIGSYRHRDMMDYLHDEGIFTDEEVEEFDTTLFNEVFDCIRCTDYSDEENYYFFNSSYEVMV